MDYLEIEKFMQWLFCLLAIIVGIGLAFLCILYETEIRLAHAMNITDDVGFAIPLEMGYNVSG